jgi:hypothetical protein
MPIKIGYDLEAVGQGLTDSYLNELELANPLTHEPGDPGYDLVINIRATVRAVAERAFREGYRMGIQTAAAINDMAEGNQ